MNVCLICKNEDIYKITTKNNNIYYSCKRCGFIYLAKKFIVNNEIEKNRYLMHNNYENNGYEEMFNKFINNSIDCNDTGKKILDYGCGFNPLLSKILKSKGFNVDIYDKYFFKEKIYLNKNYDLITITEVVEHLFNPLRYFRLFKKLLNTGGIIAGMTLFHPDSKELFQNWWYKNDITHISFYTKKTIIYIAEILNFSVLAIDNKNTFVLKKN